MTNSPFEKGAAREISEQLQAVRSELGSPYEGRWRWWRKVRRAERISRTLRQTQAATVVQYQAITQHVEDLLRHVRHTRRRYVLWLWFRVLCAALWAVIFRARVLIAMLVLLIAFAAAVYFFGLYLLRLILDLISVVVPANQTISLPTGSSNPQAPQPNAVPPASGLN